MACELSDGVQLHFLESGIKIQVFDLTTRKNSEKYSHAKAKITQEAGDLLADHGIHQEPVELQIGGQFQGRYFFPKDSLERSGDDAWLTVYDAAKILDYGAISQHYGEVVVGDVVEYIISHRDDPHGVITGWRAVDRSIVEEERQNVEEDVVENINGTDADQATDGWGGAINGTIHTIQRILDNVYNRDNLFTVNKFRGVDFDDVSPGDALREVEGVFGFTSWVDDTGTLWIGHPEAIPTQRHAISGLPTDTTYAMKDYNVTMGASPVTFVMLKGRSHFYGENVDGEIGAEPGDLLHPVAQSYIEGDDGEVAPGLSIVPDQQLNIWELASLEDAARNLLIRESMKYRNGNISFNGAASTNKAKLASMDVGDVIMVNDFIKSHCQGHVDAGSFIVTEVQHKIRSGDAWSVTVEVGSAPPNIVNESMYWNAGQVDPIAYYDDKS